MDAEIAVRDLADQTRYNVLPSIVRACGWIESEEDLNKCLDYERLALLVRKVFIYQSFFAMH